MSERNTSARRRAFPFSDWTLSVPRLTARRRLLVCLFLSGCSECATSCPSAGQLSRCSSLFISHTCRRLPPILRVAGLTQWRGLIWGLFRDCLQRRLCLPTTFLRRRWAFPQELAL